LVFIPASHEDQVSPGVLKKVLFKKDDLMKGRVQMINWACLPPGKSFAKHYHEDMEEIFIIVRGHAQMMIHKDRANLGTGDAVVVPVGQVHEMRNEGAEAVEYVVVGISRGENGKTIVVDET
jgi:mannose-6-phosphate isomerase-like protein (cupin superfamily)